jgi:hypothetical protein
VDNYGETGLNQTPAPHVLPVTAITKIAAEGGGAVMGVAGIAMLVLAVAALAMVRVAWSAQPEEQEPEELTRPRV